MTDTTIDTDTVEPNGSQRGIGDNSRHAILDDLQPLMDFMPPSYAELESEVEGLLSRRDQLLDGVSRMPQAIPDEDTERRASDLARMIGAAIRTSETTRMARNEPARQAQALVNAVYGRIAEPLVRARATVLERLTTFQRAKADAERRRLEEVARKRREDAEQQRREAAIIEKNANTEAEIDLAIGRTDLAAQAEADALQAQQAALAKPAELSRARGEYGATASLRQYWDFSDLDRDNLDLAALRPYIPQAALEQAVRAYIKAGGRQLRGVTIFSATKTAVR
jgi:hypothetical protein